MKTNDDNVKERQNLTETMQAHLDDLTKPVGSLGKLESYALKCAQIQGKVPPSIKKMAVIVFAGDHGIAEEGVSLYPQEVTVQMAANFVKGGAAINVLALQCGFDVKIVDTGMLKDCSFPSVINLKAGYGTKNFSKEPAMSKNQLDACLQNGVKLADMVIHEGYDLVALGDMGIGNTTAAAALLCASGFKYADIIDRGTGISDEMLKRKYDIIVESVKKHAPYRDPYDIMMKLGGFELNMIAGFILALKNRKIPVVLDGFPVTSGAYMAYAADPEVVQYLFAGHKSKVKGHGVVLDALKLDPILSLDMRLGEGTGAVLGGFLISCAVKVTNDMSRFSQMEVARSNDHEKNY